MWHKAQQVRTELVIDLAGQACLSLYHVEVPQNGLHNVGVDKAEGLEYTVSIELTLQS